MNRLSLFLVLLFSLLFFTGCLQRNPQADAVLSKNIAEVFVQYKQGVNKLDQQILEDIVAEEFIYYGGSKKEYLKQLLSWTVFIEEITWEVLHIEDYKVIVAARLKGTVVYKPSVVPAIFTSKVPLLQGTFQKQSIFTMAYSQAGLKILSEEDNGTAKIFQGGQVLPEIKTFNLDKYSVQPGETIKLSISVDKGANDIIFVYLNDRLLSGFSDPGEVPYNEDSFSVNVPSDHPRGKPFDIVAVAYAGKLDLRNTQQAELQGVVVKTISVPVK